MDEQKSRVYALVDGHNRITRIEGEYTLPADLEGWALIEEGEPCDRLNLAQTHYLPKGLMNDEGIYLYKYEYGEVLERTEAEIDADRVQPLIEPTLEERVNDLEIAICELVDALAE